MNILGLGAYEKIDRIDSGSGQVHEHSIEIGHSVVIVRNIGTLTMVNGSNNPWPFIAGGLLILVSLPLLNVLQGFGFGLLFFIGGGALFVWGFLRQPDIFLSIGACDGRRTNIVSKDRAFLLKVREALRRKIDNQSEVTGTINISAREISGGIALGAYSSATGASETRHEEKP